ncbi:enoyl-[acyl-carrier-protein] reductase FabK [Aminipila sp.]|uniref:enoyl-[acyl-carrier-protein] reductase FabK n=1 Tax=Aminipila sp. TaxID=2060095 RepID=UPI002F40AF42
MNDVCQILGTEYPIIQGAMARIAESSLAAAVSNGGGLGIIASGGYDADWLRNEIKKVRKLTDKPFGVNLMLLMPNIDELIEVVCEEKVPVVTTGAGNPGKYIKTLKEAGVKVIPVVASVALAVRVERAGADAVIAEGTEAGGHIGEIATMALTPQVVDAVSIPVIAAGGIADGRGVAAVYMLGAKGIQVGTRFVVAKECIVSPNYKAAIIKAKDTDTCATGRSTGHPIRVIKNKLAREILAIEKASSTGEEAQAAIDKVGIGALSAAVFDGDVERGSVMSGQIAGIVMKEQPAAEIIAEMFEEAKKIYVDRVSLF